MSTGKSNTLLAFLLGAAVGAGLALLYAPEPGIDTRRKLKEGMEDAGDWALNKYDDARDAFENNSDKVKSIVKEKKSGLKSAFETGKGAYKRGREKLLKEEPV